ncbi:MAG: LysE family translocator, partial [Planifilum fulgidum]
QMAVLGVVFTMQALLIFTAVSVIAHGLGRNVLKSAASSKWVNRTKAGIYALLGARLVFMEKE